MLLDCTIRDGGYVNNWNFSDEQVQQCYKACALSGVDYIEIGFRNFDTPEFKRKYGNTFFCKEEYLNHIISEIYVPTCKLAVMVTINAFDINDFVPKSESNISLVRVLMAYHGSKNGNDAVLDVPQLMDGIHQMNQLIDLGYEVSFNLGRIDKISNDQLYEICTLLSNTKIAYFTMADTYGALDLKDIKQLIPYIRSILRNDIKIGFHAHDNMSNGSCKALYSIENGVDMIDGCILGYGRGSGNAKTELLMMDLNKNSNKNFDFIHILEYGDKYLMDYKKCTNNLCYNIVYAMSAFFGCHVSYAIDIIEKYDKMDIRKIYDFFKKAKEEKKEMFYYEEFLKENITPP